MKLFGHNLRTSPVGAYDRPAPPAHRVSRNDPRIKLSDEKVLEARALHEFAGWSVRRVAERFGLDRDYTKRLLDCTVRSKLVPKREHLPAGVKPLN